MVSEQVNPVDPNLFDWLITKIRVVAADLIPVLWSSLCFCSCVALWQQ
jgi:hypothetical protein